MNKYIRFYTTWTDEAEKFLIGLVRESTLMKFEYDGWDGKCNSLLNN